MKSKEKVTELLRHDTPIVDMSKSLIDFKPW